MKTKFIGKPKMKAFISHANADKHIADEFFTFLKNGMGFPAESVFYTSKAETAPRGGDSFKERIRKELENTDMVFLLLSENFLVSQFCLAEVGASWVLTNQKKEDGKEEVKQKWVPLLLPNSKPADWKSGVLDGVHLWHVNNASELDEVRKEVKDCFGDGLLDVSDRKYNLARNKLLKKLDGTSRPSQKARTKVNPAKPEEKPRVSIHNQNDNMLDDEREQFGALINRVRINCKKIPLTVRETIYYMYYWPGEPVDLRPRKSADYQAIRDGFLKKNSEGVYEPNMEDSSVKDAVESIYKVHEFLEAANEDFHDWLKKQFGFPPNLSNKRFFDYITTH